MCNIRSIPVGLEDNEDVSLQYFKIVYLLSHVNSEKNIYVSTKLFIGLWGERVENNVQ